MYYTCLIAAHDPWFIQLLRVYSEECGFHVVQVYEAQDVLPMIHKEKPVAVFLQGDLPGSLRGEDVLHSIQQDAACQHTPVFLFTWLGHAMEGLPVGEPQGVTALLTEPVTFEVFQNALTSAGVGIPRKK